VISSALVIGLVLIGLNNAYTTVVPRSYPEYVATAEPEPQTQVGPDGNTYTIHHVTEPVGNVLIGRYLVDEAGQIRYLIDPGIAGTVTEVDGKPVTKLDSPKARLFSLIIDGILTQKLPWGLVLIGVSLALLMELVGVSALPFAVGLYLPISTSVPIMAGGLVRILVDKKMRSSATEAEFSPGMLMSAGFIAGGTIMGVVIAGITGAAWNDDIDLSSYLGHLAEADWFALIPFALLMFVLYRVGTSEKGNGAAK
jgi:hypothetical protein